MALIVVMTGVLVPALGGYGEASRLRAGARSVVSQLRAARELAVRHNTHVRFQIDANAGTSWLSELMPAEQDGEPTWREVTQSSGTVRLLPDGVRYARAIAHSEEQAESVVFAPDGRGQEWFVILTDRRDERLIISVTETTGTSRVLSPDDGQDYQDMLRAAQGAPAASRTGAREGSQP